VIRNNEGFLRSVGGLYGNGLGSLAHILYRAVGRMDGLLAKPFHRMSGLVRTCSH